MMKTPAFIVLLVVSSAFLALAGKPSRRFDTVSNVEKRDIDWDNIVVIGQKVWNVITNNKPDANINASSAAVVPEGITSWTQLSGWKNPVVLRDSIVYSIGVKAQFDYRVSFIWGGRINGTGAFLSNIKILPDNVSVMWPLNLNVSISIPDVANAGDPDNPMAAAELQLDWAISTPIHARKASVSYWIKGDGTIKKL